MLNGGVEPLAVGNFLLVTHADMAVGGDLDGRVIVGIFILGGICGLAFCGQVTVTRQLGCGRLLLLERLDALPDEVVQLVCAVLVGAEAVTIDVLEVLVR